MKNPQDKARQEADSLLEDYLDHFCAPLVGSVPYSERNSLRWEIASHLEALAMEYEWQGEDPVQAARSALREMGEPWAAGEAWLVEWNIGRQAKSAPSRLERATLVRPFAFFGVATMINLLLLEVYASHTGNLFSGKGTTPLLPPFLLLLMVTSPVVAGALTGYRQNAHLSRSIAYILFFLVMDSFVTGLLMLPKTEILFFTTVQFLTWIPLGIGSANLTAALVRSHRRHSFLRTIGHAH